MRKYITRQRNLSWTKIIIASAIGVFGGVYVWKPFFESLDAERPKKIKVCHFRTISISHFGHVVCIVKTEISLI